MGTVSKGGINQNKGISARRKRDVLKVVFLAGGLVEGSADNSNNAIWEAQRLAELLGVGDHGIEMFPALLRVYEVRRRLVTGRRGLSEVNNGNEELTTKRQNKHTADNKLLHLLELMDPERSPGILAVGAGFAAADRHYVNFAGQYKRQFERTTYKQVLKPAYLRGLEKKRSVTYRTGIV